ncbi:helicase-related protein [Pediococcus acidilactici]
MEANLKEKYYGRLVPVNRAEATDPTLNYFPAVIVQKQRIQCQRCGATTSLKEGSLPNQQYYCRHCLNLGRMSTLVQLGTLPEPNHFPAGRSYLKWKGQLTKAQQRCANEIIASITQKNDRLLWAVTGAGKIEMLFPGIDFALKKALRVAIASPRIDVVLELYPRIQAAFPEVAIALLHGRTTAAYTYTQLVLCTTHQLLRFYHAFDVLIIDEVDSFPFAMNPELHYAARHARKQVGTTVYLTATPDGQLLKDSRAHRLPTSYLTRRFHGHPLPEIKVDNGRDWLKLMHQQRFPQRLRQFLAAQVSAQRQFLLFIPRIEQLPLVLKAVQKQFPDLKLATVYAEDPKRLEKVSAMREGRLTGLITTTILERGVTFPGIDVAVLGADDEVFSMAALVQIAGRVGRSPQRPTGTVLFICQMLTRRIKRAQRQIKFMNRQAFK